MNFEPELEADERDALRAWAHCDAPGDFAERLATLASAESERRQQQSQRAEQAQSRPMWTAWWIGIVAAAAAVVLALSLIASPSANGGSSPDELRRAARELLARECTPCHVGDSDRAAPEAIAVFDVLDPEWDEGLSSEQLVIAMDRVAERTSGSEVAGFQRYVNAELARRGSGLR